MSPLEEFYHTLPKEHGDSLIACRDYLLNLKVGLVPVWKWRTPVFDWRGKNICYFHYEAKKDRSYIAFSAGNFIKYELLRAEGRKNMRFIILNPEADLPVEAIESCVEQVIAHLKSGGKAWTRTTG